MKDEHGACTIIYLFPPATKSMVLTTDQKTTDEIRLTAPRASQDGAK